MTRSYFDNLFGEFFEPSHAPSRGYPPFNIIKYDDTDYKLEFAVAGFTREQIEIVHDTVKEVLTISSVKEELPGDEVQRPTYLHKGIAQRSFKQQFLVAKEVEVTKADLRDGILSVHLKAKKEPEIQPKKIDIG